MNDHMFFSPADVFDIYISGKWDFFQQDVTRSTFSDHQHKLFYFLLRDLTPLKVLREAVDPHLINQLTPDQASSLTLCRTRLLGALKALSAGETAPCEDSRIASFFAEVSIFLADCVPGYMFWLRHLIAACACDFAFSLRCFQRAYGQFLAGQMPQDLTVVLGMHRSGTSALSGMLSTAGLAAPLDALGATESNPFGYWESDYLVELSNQLFVDLGIHWSAAYDVPLGWNRQSISDEWVQRFMFGLRHVFDVQKHLLLKDPRLCVLLQPLIPCFHSGLMNANYVLMLRSPVEVMYSLAKSEGLGLEQSLCLWVSSVLTSERLTRYCNRFVVTYSRLLDAPAQVLTSLGAMLSAHTLPLASEQAAQFIDASLYRQKALDLRAGLLNSSQNLQLLLDFAENIYDVMCMPIGAGWEMRLDQLYVDWLRLKGSRYVDLKSISR